jgi:4-hydroxyphenylacetate 3-monooxygenase
MTRSGATYLEALKDGRHVVIDGERVPDVTEHPAFRKSARAFAQLYDVACAEPEVMTFASPTTGKAVNQSFLIPRSQADLVARRVAMRRWASESFGFLGRTPDHVASLLTGLAAAPEVLAQGTPQFAKNAERVHAEVRDSDLYVSYVIINPQNDKSKPSSRQEEPFLHAGIVEERDGGFVIRGAKMIGTSAIFSDLLFVSTIQPMTEEDRDYAFSCIVPISSPGLKLYSRRSYEAAATSEYDHPLSSRFDENDCLVVFDDVFVSWENTFVYRDPALTAAQFFATPAHVYINTQAQIRCWTKLEFLAGVAYSIAKTNGTLKDPLVADILGRLSAAATMIRAGVVATEAEFESLPNGVVRPNATHMYATMATAGPTYATAIEAIRTLSGGGVIQVPSSVADLLADGPGADFRRYVRSPGISAEERIGLFKLAWDVVGTEFAGRHQQYEMFYSGGPFVARAYANRAYPWAESEALVDRCLSAVRFAVPVAAGE